MNETSKISWLERLSQVLLREPQDRVQLVSLLRDAEQRHLLDEQALAMMEGVLQVSVKQAKDIMVPRADMIMVNHDAKPSEFLPIIIESGHSRFPVIHQQNDEIIGVLLAKDMLSYTFTSQDKPFDIEAILRPAIFAPENIRLDRLLQEFRTKRQHMAIVIDEYDSIIGLITIEDILEEIVGEIEDESDSE